MKSTLPSTHLLRHFVLFSLVVLFLLTMARTGYALWQFPALLDSKSWLEIFVTGLRYDLALIGGLLILPVIITPFLGMLGITRLLSKSLLFIWLLFALGYVLFTELITPYFLMEQSVRPDLSTFAALKNPLLIASNFVSANVIPAVIGIILAVLIFIAFIRRLELQRLLRYRLSVGSSLALIILGGQLILPLP